MPRYHLMAKLIYNQNLYFFELKNIKHIAPKLEVQVKTDLFVKSCGYNGCFIVLK